MTTEFLTKGHDFNSWLGHQPVLRTAFRKLSGLRVCSIKINDNIHHTGEKFNEMMYKQSFYFRKNTMKYYIVYSHLFHCLAPSRTE